MDKNIFAPFLLDKAETLGVVKPLNSSFCQRTSPPFYIENCTSERKKRQESGVSILAIPSFQADCTGNKTTYSQYIGYKYPLYIGKDTHYYLRSQCFLKKSSSLNHSPSKHHVTFFRVLRLIFGCYGAPDQELFAQQIHKVLIDPPP